MEEVLYLSSIYLAIVAPKGLSLPLESALLIFTFPVTLSIFEDPEGDTFSIIPDFPVVLNGSTAYTPPTSLRP